MASDLPAEAVLAVRPGDAPGWALRGLFGLPDAAPVPPWQALAVWTTALVMREAPGYTAAVVRWVQAGDRDGWERLLALARAAGPAPTIALTGGRYLAVADRRPFDLQSGVFIDGVPPDWIVTLVFNLRTLHTACEAQALKWTPPRPPSGPTPTPRPSA